MSEPAQAIPMWQTIVALLGLGSWGATWLAYRLNSRLDRRKWIDDNKKKEWRELIVELDGSLEQMSYAFQPVNVVSATESRNNPLAGIQRGNRVMTDRIFIASALRKNGLPDKWKELKQYTNAASNPSSWSVGESLMVPSTENHTLVGFNMKASSFRDEILRVAKEDLGIK